MSTMTEVLAVHWSASTRTESKPFVDKCDGCGEVVMTWGTNGDMPALLAAHQADALTKAGYGKLADAWDEGWAHYRKWFTPVDPEFGINPYRSVL